MPKISNKDVLNTKINLIKKSDNPEKNIGLIVELFLELVKDKINNSNLIMLYDFMKEYADLDDINDTIKNKVSNIFFDYNKSKFQIENILTEQYTYPNNSFKNKLYKKRAKQFNFLKTIPQFEQRSEEWFTQREGMITASDIGTAIDLNHHQKRYTLILKKCDKGPPYKDNKFVHHGKKYEEIATMIYQFRYNVVVEEFGLIPHPFVKFIGASPDGICTKYTLDGKLSKLVGRMLEIKCPLTRNINLDGKIYGHICPEYYWAQVQIQLEVCELDECDFWQCRIEEYRNRQEFIKDTDTKKMYLSLEHGMEKGAVIQLLPKNKITEFCLFDAKYLYPPKINMTPTEYDDWVFDTINNIWKFNSEWRKKGQPEYVFDRVIYWKLTRCCNVTIVRDNDWFNKVLPQIKETWDYIEYYRKNKDKLEEFCEFIEKNKRKKNNNELFLSYAYHNYNNIKFDIDDFLSDNSSDGDNNIMKINNKQCFFLDSSDSDSDIDTKKQQKNKKKSIKKKNIKNDKKKSKIVKKKTSKGTFYNDEINSDPECMLLTDSDE